MTLKNNIEGTNTSDTISISDMITELYQIYESLSIFEEVYVTGSMAILALAYFLDENIIENTHLVPNDIDFIVYQKSNMNLIRPKNIDEFKRVQTTEETSATFTRDKSSFNYFNSFDLISRNKPQKYNIITHNGNEIRILDIDAIKDEYKEDPDLNKIKLAFIEKIKKILPEHSTHLTTFKKELTFSKEPTFEKELTTDDEDFFIPVIVKKKLNFNF